MPETMLLHGPSWLAVLLLGIIGYLLRRTLTQFEGTLDKLNGDMIQGKIHVAKLQVEARSFEQRQEMHEKSDAEHHERCERDQRELWDVVNKLQQQRAR